MTSTMLHHQQPELGNIFTFTNPICKENTTIVDKFNDGRAQTIAMYRQEMLDLVRAMPETNYELSLRDMVESTRITEPLKEAAEEDVSESARITELLQESTEEEKLEEGKNEDKRKKETKKKDKNKENRGFMLKMFMPRIPAVLKRKKSNGSSETCSKVSLEKSNSEKSADNRGSSRSSNGSGRRRSRSRKMRGCYFVFDTRESKSTGSCQTE